MSEHTDEHSERDAEAQRAEEQSRDQYDRVDDGPEAGAAGEYEQSGSLGTGTTTVDTDGDADHDSGAKSGEEGASPAQQAVERQEAMEQSGEENPG